MYKTCQIWHPRVYLTHCGLETSCGDIDIGLHWLRYWLVCLTAPSYYLNQCWLVIDEVLQHWLERSFSGNVQDIYLWWIHGDMSDNALSCAVNHKSGAHVLRFVVFTSSNRIFLNALKPKQNGRHFADILNAFSFMKMYKLRFEFHRNSFPSVQWTIFKHWFRKWLGSRQATSPYLNQWWPSLVTYNCVTLSQWIKGYSLASGQLYDCLYKPQWQWSKPEYKKALCRLHGTNYPYNRL